MKKGLALNLVSNILFFVTGFVIHYFMGNTLPAAEYGIVGTIMTVLDLEYLFLSNGARQALSKEISLHRHNTLSVIGMTTLFQLVIIAVFFCLDFFGSPWLSSVLNDLSLDFYLKVAAFLIIVNGLNVILLGINDGLHHFVQGAIINTVYPIAKLLTITFVMFIFTDRPVLGLEVAYISANLISILLGLIMLVPYRGELRERNAGGAWSFGAAAKNTLSFSFFFIMVSLVLSVDTLVVKAVVEPAEMAGYYTGAVNFGKIPYYLCNAFCTMILPLVARLVGKGERGKAMAQVHDFMMLIVAFVLPIAVVLSSTSSVLLVSFYSSDYAVAADALSCLAMSSFFMGLTVFFNMALTSFAASNRFSDILSIASLVIDIPVFIVSARHGGITAIAVTSMACTAVAMVLSLVALWRAAGSPFTRKAGYALAANMALWVVMRFVARAMTAASVTNLLLVICVYGVAYLVFVGVLMACHVAPSPKELQKSRVETPSES